MVEHNGKRHAIEQLIVDTLCQHGCVQHELTAIERHERSVRRPAAPDSTSMQHHKMLTTSS